MKIDILFALPGPRNSIESDKLLVVAAATEHEDPAQLDDILAEVVETAVTAGTYGTIRKVTLELDESAVLAMLQNEATFPVMPVMPAKLDRSTLH